jgi:actin cytoskeleton-regulatory complex protein PAN1
MNQAPAVSPSPPTSTGGTNPFFRPQPPVTTPTPPPVKATYTTAPTESDDEWDDLKEKEEEDSSDDEYNKSRGTRDMLAQKIFGGMMPSRGQSPATPTSPPPAPAAPPPPPAPQAPVATPSPAPPAAPLAPPPPAFSATSAPAASAGRGALFSQITSGVPKLRKAVTNDRSTAAVSGNVLGDSAPPPHMTTQPHPPPSPSRTAESLAPESWTESTSMSRHSSRQSVDWYAGLAADGSTPPQLPTTVEEEEEFQTPPTIPSVPDIQIDDSATLLTPEVAKDPLEDVDQNIGIISTMVHFITVLMQSCRVPGEIVIPL